MEEHQVPKVPILSATGSILSKVATSSEFKPEDVRSFQTIHFGSLLLADPFRKRVEYLFETKIAPRN